ncbi:unnamed protein product [Angiostrongylus costaricensis]|uniref:T-box domain-containing protein n=1 Tax=Angiostrongylus costaricensis TaxID=334426 RepID=A0A158PFP4_ANGCS|nr:unnamed protein product [Angiostrongylus costaricensis]
MKVFRRSASNAMGLGVKRARFSIETLLQARSCFPESDLSPCSSPDLPSSKNSQATDRTKSSRQSIKGDLLDGMECRLEGAELWEKFYELGTEMIITKSGRRMFPTVKVSVSNIDTDGLYYIFLDVIPVDNKRYRYIYNKSAWLTAGKAEPAPKNRLYLHPDSPYTGEQLLKQVVSFEKAKLTNNEIDKAGHLILNSMHKYQPRIHIVRRNKGHHLDHHKEIHRTFVFTETQFMAVTAYQNQLITKLKIEKNPFAKGFRDPSDRSPEYESDSRSDLPLIMPMYNPVIFQQALLSQCKFDYVYLLEQGYHSYILLRQLFY